MFARRHNVKAHFWQTLANYCQGGGGLVMGVILARMLEPQVFGQYAMVAALVSFLMIPLSFSAAQLLVSDAGKTEALFAQVMGATWLVVGLKATALAICSLWLFYSQGLTSGVVCALVGIPMVFADWIGAIRSDLEGRSEFRPNFNVQFTQVITTGIISILLVYLGFGIYGLAVGPLFGFIPALLIYLRSAKSNPFRAQFSRAVIRKQFRVGFWLWLGSVCAAWFTRIDKLAVGRFGSDAQLGYYNRAFNYGPVSHILLDSLMTNVTVRAIAVSASPRLKLLSLAKPMLIATFGGLLNGLLWWHFADRLVPCIFGMQWTPSVRAFQWLGWLSLAYVFANGMTTALLAEKRFRELAYMRFGALALLASLLGAVGSQMILTAEAAAKILLVTLSISSLPTAYFAIRSLGCPAR